MGLRSIAVMAKKPSKTSEKIFGWALATATVSDPSFGAPACGRDFRSTAWGRCPLRDFRVV